MKPYTFESEIETLTLWVFILFVLGLIGGYGTHIFYCIKLGMWPALIAGALMPPIGIIHGIMIWFGYGLIP